MESSTKNQHNIDLKYTLKKLKHNSFVLIKLKTILWQPRLDCFKSETSSSVYKLNSKGNIAPPCVTPFDIAKFADFLSPHCAGQICRVY